jgi:Hemolysins and related proteins containing CBS domains
LDIQSSVQSLTVPSANLLAINGGLLALLIILVLFSAFFSMTETVFASISEAKIKNYVEERRTGAKKALYCVEHFDRTLTTLLVGNNIVNTALSTFALTFFMGFIKTGNLELISTAIITIVLLIFGEITPKTIGKKYNDRLVLFLAPIIYVISYILFPISIIFMGVQKLFTGKKNTDSQVNESELETILDTMVEDGEIEDDEHEYIKNVFDLNDRTVEEIMIPRVDMVAIEDTASIEDVKNIFIREQYSRIPVYHEDKDHIIGIVYERDFFEAMAKNIELKNVKQLMRNVLFVNKKMTVDALIKTLQESKTHMAIVSGEYNDTLGLVTMEDALEEIVGEIYDEHDEGSVKQKLITKINDNTYMVDGDMFVSDMFEEIGLGEAPEGASKLSTWMFESQEDLPKIGDKMTYISCFTDQNEEGEYEDYAKKIILEIVEVDDRRIETVKVTVSDATEEEVEQFEESKEDE